MAGYITLSYNFQVYILEKSNIICYTVYCINPGAGLGVGVGWSLHGS